MPETVYTALLVADAPKERVLPGLRPAEPKPLTIPVWRDVDAARRANPISGGRTLYRVLLPNGWDSDVLSNDGGDFLAVDALAVRSEW